MAIFRKSKYTLVNIKKLKQQKKKNIPDGIWTKCEECGEIIYNKALEENAKVCPKCTHHFIITAQERVDILVDEGSFLELDENLTSCDPLEFVGPKTYKDKLKSDQKTTGMKEAIIYGTGKISGKDFVLAVTDSRFIMGSMGSVVGEKITRAIELATEKNYPLVIVSGSGGGARMYEGMFSLMQMAKTSAALSRLHKSKNLFISVLTHPTMAGIMASFASLGDVIMAEPKALIGFTGPRVIEQTIKQKLPEGFQRSEFLLEHGLIDMIVERSQMKDTLAKLIDYLAKK
jgi:acetyl-CoA carboxylase carboxyl transferase subunit beta